MDINKDEFLESRPHIEECRVLFLSMVKDIESVKEKARYVDDPFVYATREEIEKHVAQSTSRAVVDFVLDNNVTLHENRRDPAKNVYGKDVARSADTISTRTVTMDKINASVNVDELNVDNINVHAFRNAIVDSFVENGKIDFDGKYMSKVIRDISWKNPQIEEMAGMSDTIIPGLIRRLDKTGTYINDATRSEQEKMIEKITGILLKKERDAFNFSKIRQLHAKSVKDEKNAMDDYYYNKKLRSDEYEIKSKAIKENYARSVAGVIEPVIKNPEKSGLDEIWSNMNLIIGKNVSLLSDEDPRARSYIELIRSFNENISTTTFKRLMTADIEKLSNNYKKLASTVNDDEDKIMGSYYRSDYKSGRLRKTPSEIVRDIKHNTRVDWGYVF
jgi:hypothetical protein